METHKKTKIQEPFLPENTPVPPQVMDPSRHYMDQQTAPLQNTRLNADEKQIKETRSQHVSASESRTPSMSLTNDVLTIEPEY